MKTTAIIPESNSYWNVLKDLSDEVKLDLISRLSQSLLCSKTEKKTISASSFYGVWEDSDSLDVDRLVREVRESHYFKDDIEAF